MARNFRGLLYTATRGAGTPPRQAGALAGAKVLVSHLIPQLASIDCPPAVMGTALAIVVGAIAAQIKVGAREDFYEKFLSAARACEEATAGRIRETRIH